MGSPGPLLKRHYGTASFVGWTHFLWEILAAAFKLGLASATQTCFPEVSSSVWDSLLASAPSWVLVLDSVVLTSCEYLALCLPAWLLDPYLGAQPATHAPCVWAFLYSTCHPKSLACLSWAEVVSTSSLITAWIDLLCLSTLIRELFVNTWMCSVISHRADY